MEKPACNAAFPCLSQLFPVCILFGRRTVATSSEFLAIHNTLQQNCREKTTLFSQGATFLIMPHF
jgi:hypothetical protein